MFFIYLKLRTKHDLRDRIVHNTIRLMWNSTWMLGIKTTYNSIVWFLNINPINHFLWFSTIDNSICWVFSKIIVWTLLDLSCAIYTCLSSKYMHPIPTLTAKGWCILSLNYIVSFYPPHLQNVKMIKDQ